MPRVKKWIWKLVETDEWMDVPNAPVPPIVPRPAKPVPPAAGGRSALVSVGAYELESIDEHGRRVILDEHGKPMPQHEPTPQKMLEFSAFEQVGVGRGPVGLEPVFRAIDEHEQRRIERNLGQFPTRAGEDPELSVLDHPYIGGKFSACVLCYGDHLDLAQRCLGSIVHHAPVPGRIDLRVALNQPSRRVLDYVMGFPKGVISQVYADQEGRRKYRAMREMFWDACRPIETNYVLWFDDDSHVVDPKWLVKLGREIVANHPQQCRLYGAKYYHDLMAYRKGGHAPEKWFHDAPWWKGRWMHMADANRVGPNGHVIAFVSGGFWAIAAEAIRAADVPDVRLDHHGGDVTIGEQVHQAGFKIKNFNADKRIVAWSDAPPRGASRVGAEKEFPWARAR